jgi:hypothetical protein
MHRKFYIVAVEWGGKPYAPEQEICTDEAMVLREIDQHDDGIISVTLVDLDAGKVADVTQELVKEWLDTWPSDRGVGPEWAYDLIGSDRDEVIAELDAIDAQNSAVARGVYSK